MLTLDRVLCEGTSVGLVRYPSTLAPVSNVIAVSAECVENAHRTSSSLNVLCTYEGYWQGETPECECDSGHQEVVNDEGLTICQGL